MSRFPGVSLSQWNDWRWQMRNRYTTAKGLESFMKLSDDERAALERHGARLPVAVTPYYASLLASEDASQGLRRSVVPVMDEFVHSTGENDDPLGEEPFRPVPAIVHRYPDRCLLLVTGFCGTYCRYCTRSRLVGDPVEFRVDMAAWQKGIDYIAATPAIRDVLITGGDPLTLSDEKLEWILSRLRKIPHVEFLRIGSKIPVVLPQRVTPALARIIKKYHPLYMSIHVIHPLEVTPEMQIACGRLADAGIPLGGHTVLLKGINDDVEVMKTLMHRLLVSRVKPYYLFHCDPISGSKHLRTSVDAGLDIIAGLRGHTTGYAVPHYAIDLAGAGGKVALVPEYVEGRMGDELLVRNYRGDLFRYPDMAERSPASAGAPEVKPALQ
ncbi:MAG: KamA family radical SAM protein [Bdellovibrionia bacterium]